MEGKCCRQDSDANSLDLLSCSSCVYSGWPDAYSGTGNLAGGRQGAVCREHDP